MGPDVWVLQYSCIVCAPRSPNVVGDEFTHKVNNGLHVKLKYQSALATNSNRGWIITHRPVLLARPIWHGILPRLLHKVWIRAVNNTCRSWESHGVGASFDDSLLLRGWPSHIEWLKSMECLHNASAVVIDCPFSHLKDHCHLDTWLSSVLDEVGG